MADFFEKLQAVVRSNQGGERERTPDYLQTHPVTDDAHQRSARSAPRSWPKPTSRSSPPTAPATTRCCPARCGSAALQRGDSGQFPWARERLRVLSADTPDAAVREYERMRTARTRQVRRCRSATGWRWRSCSMATPRPPRPNWRRCCRRIPATSGSAWRWAQAEARSGKADAADARFEALLARMPGNRAVALTYAGMLDERNTPAAGKRAQAILRPLLAQRPRDDPVFQQTFARASEIAGDPVRAGEAWAEAAYLNGRPEQALVQLNTLKKRSDVDYYARARIDARIAAITPTVLELRREGIKDEDLHRR